MRLLLVILVAIFNSGCKTPEQMEIERLKNLKPDLISSLMAQ